MRVSPNSFDRPIICVFSIFTTRKSYEQSPNAIMTTQHKFDNITIRTSWLCVKQCSNVHRSPRQMFKAIRRWRQRRLTISVHLGVYMCGGVQNFEPRTAVMRRSTQWLTTTEDAFFGCNVGFGIIIKTNAFYYYDPKARHDAPDIRVQHIVVSCTNLGVRAQVRARHILFL